MKNKHAILDFVYVVSYFDDWGGTLGRAPEEKDPMLIGVFHNISDVLTAVNKDISEVDIGHWYTTPNHIKHMTLYLTNWQLVNINAWAYCLPGDTYKNAIYTIVRRKVI